MKKFIVFFALIISVNVFACKCAYQSFGERFEKSEFIAEVEILKTYNVDFNNGEDDRFYKADIKILKLYKGKKISSILVRGKVGNVYESACEIELKVGQKMLVYLDTESNFGMSSCTPKTDLNNKNINIERKALEFLIAHKIKRTNVFYFSGDYFNKFKNITAQNSFAVYKIKVDAKSKAESITVIQNFGSNKDEEILFTVKKELVFLKNFMTEIKNEEIILVMFYNPKSEEVISNFIQ